MRFVMAAWMSKVPGSIAFAIYWIVTPVAGIMLLSMLIIIPVDGMVFNPWSLVTDGSYCNKPVDTVVVGYMWKRLLPWYNSMWSKPFDAGCDLIPIGCAPMVLYWPSNLILSTMSASWANMYRDANARELSYTAE
jgi:hypothetical protein